MDRLLITKTLILELESRRRFNSSKPPWPKTAGICNTLGVMVEKGHLTKDERMVYLDELKEQARKKKINVNYGYWWKIFDFKSRIAFLHNHLWLLKLNSQTK